VSTIPAAQVNAVYCGQPIGAWWCWSATSISLERNRPPQPAGRTIRHRVGASIEAPSRYELGDRFL